MATFQIKSDKFQNNTLSLEISSFFKGPIVSLNGTPVKLVKRTAVVKDDSFSDCTIVLSGNLFELPSIKIDGDTIYPAGKLKFSERLFVMLPLALLVIGGAIGGGLGAFGSYVNLLLMIRYKDSNLKYLLAVTTTGVAFIFWLIFYLAIQMIKHR